MTWVDRDVRGLLPSLRSGYSGYITSAGHLVLLLVAFKLERIEAWIIALTLISGISFIAWAASLKRNRAIADTPTSRIGSAAQGYAELYGRACSDEEFLASGKLGSLPCIWYRYTTYRKTADNKWQEIARGISSSLFGVEDGSGRVLVDPDHAEVITSHRRSWQDGDYRHVEEQLYPSDRIYLLGDFTTLGGAHVQLDSRQDVAALLDEWKRNRPALLERFDLDGNGEIDLKEWELARRAAHREVEQQHRELRLTPGVHVMRAPTDGRHFLIANYSPQALKRRFVWWGWFHLAVFFAALAGTVRLTVARGGLW